MKGLMLKDIYNVRFQIFAGMLIVLFQNIMGFLMGGGMFAAAEDPSEAGGLMLRYSSVILFGLINYISITICSSFLLNTVSADEKSGWVKMQRVMPVTDKAIIGGKLAVMGFVLAALTLISTIFNLAAVVLFGLPAESMLALPVCIALIHVIPLFSALVFVYRFGAKLADLFYIFAVILVAGAEIGLLLAFFNQSISVAFLRITAYAVIPALAAATAAICYNSGKKVVAVDI